MSKSLPNTEIVTPIIRALWESVPESKNLVLRIKAMRARLNPVANSVQWRWMLADDGKIPVGDACASFEEARDIAERLIMKRLEK